MTVEKRMRLIRAIEKIEKNEKYSEKLGVKNKSCFKMSSEQQREIKNEIHNS